jgi:hypothetical protein
LACASPPHFVPKMWKRSERGYSNSRVQMKINLTSVTVFTGATRGYLIGRGQIEVHAPDEWHRLKLNGLATHT